MNFLASNLIKYAIRIGMVATYIYENIQHWIVNGEYWKQAPRAQAPRNS